MKNTCLAIFLFIVFIFAPTESYSKRSLEAYECWGVYYETSDGVYLLFGGLTNYVKLSDTSDKEYIRFSVTLSRIEDFISYSNKNIYMTFYYRQDGDRIYRYDESSGNDLMLYDFGLSEGDIVEDGDGNRMLVEKVFEARNLSDFSMFVDGEKAFQLRGVDDPSLEDTWIENVGSIKTGLLLASDLEGMKTASLSFFSASNGRYSLAFPTNTDCLKAVPFLKQDAYPDDYDPDLFPDDCDPDYYGPDDDMDNYLLFDFIDDTLFVKGRLRQRMSPDEFDVMGGVVNNGTIYVFFQNMHFLYDETINSIGSSDFEVKIPGFEPGTYTIKTLSLFMEMPDTTIVCHGPAPGIDQTNYSTIPGSILDDNEKTWILKCIETDENGKRTVITRDITNIYAESVKISDLDCVDMKEPARDEYDNIYFKHHVFREQTAGMVYQCYGYGDYNTLYKLYDFGLEKGQQLERYDHSKYEVTDCGFASDYDPYWSAHCPDRRMLQIHRQDAEGDDVWIEGVGSVHFGLFEPSDFNTCEVYVQSMFHGQDDCAFFGIDTDVFKSVPFEAEILETNDPLVEEIIMNQFNNNTTFDIEFKDDTLHVRGALMGETRGTLKTLEAQIEDDVITLSVSEPTFKRITSGLPYRFDVKIPGFKAGKYKIRYSYKNPIEVVCLGDATGIEELKNTDPQPTGFDSDVIYDLSGRRLNQVPEHGLYIQNGKVIFR